MKKKPVTAAHCRRVLKDVVGIINRASDGDGVAASFRDVVTALRGPDNELLWLKESTTAHIRHDIGIKPSSGLIIEKGAIRIPEPDSYISDHFVDHVVRARDGLAVLGLLKK